MKKVFSVFIYILVLILSSSFIYYGNQYIKSGNSSRGIGYNREEELDSLVYAKIVSIDNVIDEEEAGLSNKEIDFTGRTFGNSENQDKLIEGKQIINDSSHNTEAVSIGDKVVLLSYGGSYTFQYYYRFNKVVALGIIFTVLILMMGGIKGFNTIVSLALTCLSIFFVFVPSIGAGFNIYISTIVVCLFIIVSTLVLVYGLNKKSVAASLSCISGVVFSGILCLIIDKWMKLTGYINENTYMLNNLFGIDINIKAVIFSMITIGALGAIMDVSMSITSSLCELSKNSKKTGPEVLMKSGFGIGRDIMGTMANTLVLAYIGSSLIVVLVYAASGYPILSILNKEEIIFEFLQSLVGSFSLLFTIPFTVFIASMIYGGNGKMQYRAVFRR